MKTIIRINKDDGTKTYVQHTYPTIELTDSVDDALRMDFQTAVSVSLALNTLKIGHSMITKPNW